MAEEGKDGRVFGFAREQLVFVGGPLLANVLLIAFYFGECFALGIPIYLISITPVDVLTFSVTGIFVTSFIAQAVLLGVIARGKQRRSAEEGRKQPGQPTKLDDFPLQRSNQRYELDLGATNFQLGRPGVLAVILIVACFGAVFMGFVISRSPASWVIVPPTSTCVLVVKFGDNFIAADYPQPFRTFTVYHIDHLPVLRTRADDRGYEHLKDFKPTRENPTTSCPAPEREKGG